ncbi:DUF4382 domain-containing protein [Thioalkalivibrio sp.]|uniref:DUF4382 domain-containing protein n=1 Tax=Thioalkalivibrio sp. TaxID=2093813 RepID=UPI0039770B73
MSLAVMAALLLTACGGGGTSGDPGDSGLLSLYVTDAPVHSVAEVWVTFDAIELKPASGPALRFELEPPVREDLLALQGENSAALIEDLELEAGQYNWIRLFVVTDGLDDADLDVQPSRVVEESGGGFPLFVPGNQPPSRNPNQRFVQLSSPFVVPVEGEASFTIDVDLQQALVKKQIPASPEPFYLLRPSLRIEDNSEIATIYGDVPPTLICVDDMGTAKGNAVYVYRGLEVNPGDAYLDADGEVIPRDDIAHPITTANVKQDPEDGLYRYTVGFLAAGDYTVAFTCDAAADEPESDEVGVVTFLQQHAVTVEAGDRVRQDFDDPPLD